MFTELKELWERLNEPAILEYMIKDESEFAKFLVIFYLIEKIYLSQVGLKCRDLA
ncbi:hypothetical protein VB002_10485 [Campylobacter concisus]